MSHFPFHFPYPFIIVASPFLKLGQYLGVLPQTARLTILGKFIDDISLAPIWVLTLSPISTTVLTETSQTQLHLHWLRLPTPFFITRPFNPKDFTSHYYLSTGSVSSLRRGSRTPHACIAASQDPTYSHTIWSCVQHRREGAGRVFRSTLFLFSVLARQRTSSGAGTDTSQ